jgi:hypothetical protein
LAAKAAKLAAWISKKFNRQHIAETNEPREQSRGFFSPSRISLVHGANGQ